MTPLLVSVLSLGVALPANLSGQIPQPVMTRFTYAVITEADTAWQYVIRSPVTFQADVVFPKQGASLKMAGVDSAGLVRRLTLDVWQFPPRQPETKWTHAQNAAYERPIRRAFHLDDAIDASGPTM